MCRRRRCYFAKSIFANRKQLRTSIFKLQFLCLHFLLLNECTTDKQKQVHKNQFGFSLFKNVLNFFHCCDDCCLSLGLTQHIALYSVWKFFLDTLGMSLILFRLSLLFYCYYGTVFPFLPRKNCLCLCFCSS